jgi:hypothetical protein
VHVTLCFNRAVSLRRVSTFLLLVCGVLMLAPLQTGAADARTVLAAVVGRDGRALVDVGIDDFVVTEGGQPREVLDLHIADYPLAIVIDDRPEAAAALPVIRTAARRFIERVGERPIAILRLSNAERPLATLDDERGVVLDRLASIEPSSGTPATPPLDTIARAAGLLAETGAPFSAVVVAAGAPVDASALVRGELLPRIIESGAAVHVVQVQSSAPPLDGPAGPDLMRLVADQTRGQFTAIFAAPSYDAALDRLADRLAIELMVQYLVPPGPKAGDVQVGVRVPGARVVGLGVK